MINYRIQKLVVVAIFMSAGFGLLANDDSLKRKYSLDDPRNPDCPCRKYQALAEKEYKQANLLSGKQNETDEVLPASKISANRTGGFRMFDRKAMLRKKGQTKRKARKHSDSGIDRCYRW